MAKRISSEERIISYFMSTAVEQAGQMLRTVQAIVRQRTGGGAQTQPVRRLVKDKGPRVDTVRVPTVGRGEHTA